MNCQKTEQLIPLFVEADLDAAEMQQVTQHLETCEPCGEIVIEFQASQSSLRAAALPEFDEAMWAETRRAVNREIARTFERAPVFTGLSLLWNWKLACAAVVMLCVSGFVFYSKFSTKSACCSTGSVSDLRFDQGHVGSDPGPYSKGHIGKDAGRLRSPYRNRIRVASPSKQLASVLPETLPEVVEPDHSVEAATVPSSLAQPRTEETYSAPEPEMLRMEFQTADPNIKIIWLTPKEPTRTNPAADIQ